MKSVSKSIDEIVRELDVYNKTHNKHLTYGKYVDLMGYNRPNKKKKKESVNSYARYCETNTSNEKTIDKSTRSNIMLNFVPKVGQMVKVVPQYYSYELACELHDKNKKAEKKIGRVIYVNKEHRYCIIEFITPEPIRCGYKF